MENAMRLAVTRLVSLFSVRRALATPPRPAPPQDAEQFAWDIGNDCWDDNDGDDE